MRHDFIVMGKKALHNCLYITVFLNNACKYYSKRPLGVDMNVIKGESIVR